MLKVVISRARVDLNNLGKFKDATIIRTDAGVLIVFDDLTSISFESSIPEDITITDEHRIVSIVE